MVLLRNFKKLAPEAPEVWRFTPATRVDVSIKMTIVRTEELATARAVSVDSPRGPASAASTHRGKRIRWRLGAPQHSLLARGFPKPQTIIHQSLYEKFRVPKLTLKMVAPGLPGAVLRSLRYHLNLEKKDQGWLRGGTPFPAL